MLTHVVTADINAPETGMRVMQSAYALAAPFGATVVIRIIRGSVGWATDGFVTLPCGITKSRLTSSQG